jgi:hypothetical protein
VTKEGRNGDWLAQAVAGWSTDPETPHFCKLVLTVQEKAKRGERGEEQPRQKAP